MTAVLYAIPASHPCAAAEKALQLKGVPYRRVELIPVVSRLPLRLRFGAGSVPALRFGDGARVTGSRPIVRALEQRVPQPPLLPADGDRRVRVVRAEEWGEQVLQPLVRRVLWAGLRRAPKAVESYAEGAKLPVPRPLARASAPLVARMSQRVNRATDPNVRADLIGLRTHLGRVDGWIADGTLGGEHVNAADLQVGASLRLLLTVEDVRPLLEDRPAAALARRWFPAYPGAVPAGTLPRDWLPACSEARPRTRPISRSAPACACCSRWRTCGRCSTNGPRARSRAAGPRPTRARRPRARSRAPGSRRRQQARRRRPPRAARRRGARPRPPRARRARPRPSRRPGPPRPGASSSSGTSTKRRLVTCSCGSDRRSER